MKSIIRLLFLLFVVFTSCKKDASTVETVPETEDSLVVLTKAYYYSGDTSATPMIDSFYYNAIHRIEKVVTTSALFADTIIYTLTYNSNGDLSTVKGNGVYWHTKQEYSFYYNANRRLDSLIMLDHSFNDDSICTTFSYDANDHIKGYYSYFLKTHPVPGQYPPIIEGSQLSSGSFYRNSNSSDVDSIFSRRYISGTLSDKLFTHFNATGNSGTINIDRSYLFILSTRPNIYMSYNINPFWYQYLNPDVPMFKGGTFTQVKTNATYDNTKHPFDCKAETDNENRIHLINITGKTLETGPASVKLEYTRIAQ